MSRSTRGVNPLLNEALLGDGSIADEVDAEVEVEDDDVENNDRDYFPSARPAPQSLLVRFLREVSSNRFATYATIALHVPLFLGTVGVLGMQWSIDSQFNDDDFDDTYGKNGMQCDDLKGRMKDWRLWAVVTCVRLVLATWVQWRRYVLVDLEDLPENDERVKNINSKRNLLEAAAIVWFVVGNLWVFANQKYIMCGQKASWIYWACVVNLSAQYLQICLLCLVALALVPVFCFCLPCFVRLMNTLHDPMAGKGADWKLIDSIPVVEYQPPPLAGGAADAEQDEVEAPTCAICLGSFEAGDSTRLLPCKHQFHVGCIDHWLIVNATCPNCRQPIDSNRGPGGCSSSSGGDGSSSSSSSSSSSNNNRSHTSVRSSGRSSSANATVVNSRTSTRASSASVRNASFRTSSSSSSDRITLSDSSRSSRPSNPRTFRRPVRRVSDDDIGIDPGPSTRSRHVETGSSSSTAGGGRAGSEGGSLPRLLSNIGSVLVGAAELAADTVEAEGKDSEGDVESAFLRYNDNGASGAGRSSIRSSSRNSGRR